MVSPVLINHGYKIRVATNGLEGATAFVRHETTIKAVPTDVGHSANGGSGDCRMADTRVQGVAGNRGAADSEWCQKKCVGRELR